MSNEIEKVDDSFVDKIDQKRLQEYIYIIKDLAKRGMNINDIATYLGLMPSQIAIMQRHKDYLSVVQEAEADEADVFRRALRSHITKAADILKDKVDEGDMAALKLFVQAIGADKAKEKRDTTAALNFIDVVRKLGLKTREEEKQKQVLDADYEEIDETCLELEEKEDE